MNPISQCIGVKALGILPHSANVGEFRPSSHHSSGHEVICRKCKNSYNYARINGTIKVTSREKSLVGQFLSALDVSAEAALDVLKAEAKITNSGCWEWKRSLVSGGYGAFRITRKDVPESLPKLQMVHRWSFWLSSGGDTAETVHHKCSNRKCFNPVHLEKATQKENIGEMFARKSYEKRIAYLEQKVSSLELEIELLKGSEKFKSL